MTTIGEQIRDARKALSLTQKEFSAALGMSENYIWQIEKGQREPSDRTISDICRIFAIREEWLRTGTGEMRLPMTKEEEIAQLVNGAINGSSEFKRAVIKMICSRTDSELEALEAALRSVYENL
ncbi:helix-turn-helix domain-containing protein [Prevotella sp.]|uniref:helix-turn-helix domain-containing protein n=1 Tax=Prevotella sp. TaxID=59823 RepID=UPI0027E2CE5A|nr:helix-turn-helix domain-containing protein [Prevotella sp.]